MKYIFRKKRNRWAAAVLDALGGFLFFWVKKKQLPTGGFKSFLIVRLDHLGDVFPATAVPKLLKEKNPSCRVFFLTSSAAAPLVENNPFVDEIIVYDAPWFARKQKKRSVSSYSFFSLAQALKARKIEAALMPRGDLRESALTALAGIPARIGYGITGGGFLLTRQLPYRSGVHESEHWLDLLKAFGIPAPSLEGRVYLSESEKNAAEHRLEKWGVSPALRRIGIQVDAGTPAKEWPFENLKELLSSCLRELPRSQLILVGSDADKSRRLRECLSPPAGQWADLVGRTSLRELLYLLGKMDIFIGPDSGPSHMAAGLGVRTLFLYSGTNRTEEWKPLAESAAFLKNTVPCAPCGLLVCNVKGHPCMSGISASEVFTLLNQRPS